MGRGTEKVDVSLNLGLLSVGGTWRPTDEERRAAWELYVELATRVAVVPLQPNEGLLREALSSLYALFGVTRQILRSYGRAWPGPARTASTTSGSWRWRC